VTDFFHAPHDESIDYPSWVGELYLELHRGTYTTQARNKLLNRRAEFLYRDAELLSTIAAPLGLKYPYEALHRKWQDILCNQFHDVIPGSSIRLVYEDTEQMYPEVFRVGEDAVASAVEKIAGGIDSSQHSAMGPLRRREGGCVRWRPRRGHGGGWHGTARPAVR